MMSVYHVPADYMLDNWSEEFFEVMAEAMAARTQREKEEMEKQAKEREGPPQPSTARFVTKPGEHKYQPFVLPKKGEG